MKTKTEKPTKPNRSDTVAPEETVNIFSYLSFAWLDPIFIDGYKRPLETTDIWKLPPRLQTQQLCDEFESAWLKEVQDSKTTNATLPSTTPQIEPSIYRAIHKFMFWKLAPAGLIKVFCDACTITAPYLLKQIILYVTESQRLDAQNQTPPPLYWGFVYVAILFSLNMSTTISLNFYFQRTTTLGMGLRTAVSAAIYRKSLKLSSAARQDFNAGKVMNFISTDCQRIERFIMFCHILWTGPIQIVAICAMLVVQLGWPAFAGIGFMIGLTPIQMIMYRRLAAIRKTVAPIADARIKCTTEALQGIKVIKFFG